jgi:DNA polymerase-3 subunit epsilon
LFAIVDIETTGSYAKANNITEIAICISDGQKILSEFSSLVRPERSIPANITALTGIDDNMVSDAPRFAELADKVREMLGDHVFVAHNVNFDLSFIQAAFKEIGVNYNPKRLCTVRYGRKVESGLRSYSLKNISAHFGLINESSHRAWGDARVTAKLLQILLAKDKAGEWQIMIRKNSGELNLPANLKADDYHNLPDAPGVYYFHNSAGKAIYIGKATRLKQRVSTHFTAEKSSAKSAGFKREIYSISYQLSGSTFMAGILEDEEIRKHWPEFNRAQKKPKIRFGVFPYKDQKGNNCLVVNRIGVQQNYWIDFYSLDSARTWLAQKAKHYQLAENLCGFPNSSIAIDQEKHNANFDRFEADLNQLREQQIILTKGRRVDEQGIIWIENGQVVSTGFVPKEMGISNLDELEPFLELRSGSATIGGLIRNALESQEHQVIKGLPKI